MKKIYILALALGAFTFATQAQTVVLTDDFESYTTGGISAQSDHWRTWSGDEGTAEDGRVTDGESNSGFQSVLIDGSVMTDLLLLVPSPPTSGIYTVQFYVFIPEGKSGYMNMQAAMSSNSSAWQQALMGGNIYFNCKDDDSGNGGNMGGQGGVSGGIDCTTFEAVFDYPEGEWFKMTNIYDLTNQSWSMLINGQPQFSDYPFEFGGTVFLELAAIDFYSSSTNNEMYVDDVTLAEGVLSTENFNENVFSVYPNPFSEVLNISSKVAVDQVIVYDILGKVVLTENPGMISPSINTSNLSSGTYMVKVKIGNNSKIVKIVK